MHFCLTHYLRVNLKLIKNYPDLYWISFPCKSWVKLRCKLTLHLLVKKNGSKYWRLKYRYLGKKKTLAIGVYPEVTLEDAREDTTKARVSPNSIYNIQIFTGSVIYAKRGSNYVAN